MKTINSESDLYDILYLLAAELNDTVPDKERVKKMNLENLFSVCKLHSLTAIASLAIEKAGVKIVDKWTEERMKSIRKNMLLDAERAKLFEFCEANGIWYTPLKGVILKDLYPQIGERQMADNDILFDKKYRKEIHDYFIARGYKAESYGRGNHDEYQKNPVYNYEMHISLFNSINDKRWVKYYENVYERLIKDKNNNYGYHFSDNDFYIYFIMHGFKHYSDGGTGLRTLIDCYIYNCKKQLDYKYIGIELNKMGASEFEKKIRDLSYRVFENNKIKLSEKDIEELKYIMNSGTHGSFSHIVENKMAECKKDGGSVSKSKYFFKRLVPDMNAVKEFDPFFYRHKFLLPFFFVYRLFRGLTLRRKKSFIELKTFFNKKDN